MPTLFEQYEKKKRQLEWNRLRAFSSISHVRDVGGIPLNPLTARAWVDLRLVGNPMFEGVPTVEGICQYLYRNHSDYPISGWQKYRIERMVSKSLKREEKGKKLFEEILEHMSDAFSEVPESAGSESVKKTYKMPPVEGVVAACDELAARYGQHPDRVMDMPLEQLFALQKAARLATIPNYKVLEPPPLREIKSKYLKENGNGKR